MDEITKLKEENKKLKAIFKDLGYIFIDENMELNKQQKLDIFMNYFKGRNEVYALKYWNNKQNKFAYSFDCHNKFKNNCPILKKQKCTIDCHFYAPKSLTQEVILKHFQKPNQSIGLYPLLDDDTCYLLAIDFDNDLWFENMLSVYRTAKKYSIPCLMERSQSGNGGHLWIFFEHAIKATKARKLGDFLLKESMKSNKNLSFQSFDRMFPSQDYHTGKRLGNLIALPMQYDAMIKGNSLFINEFQNAIKKPFHYLMALGKVKEEDIDHIIDNQETHLKNYFNTDNHINLLDYIEEPLHIKEDSLIHISKKGLSAKSLLTIRRLSSTYNPDYYKNIRLHISVYNTPRILCEYIEDDYEIAIPRGLKEKLLCYINQETSTIEENICTGNIIDISFKGSLYPQQQEAANHMLEHQIAILEAIPGFGKTIIALYLMSIIQKSTLIIVNSKELLLQWKEKIDEFIEYPKAKLKKDHYIGELHGQKKKLTHQIDVALIQSLAHLKDMSSIQNYGLVLIDECHHASSYTYRSVLQNLNAQYIYSFSGTPQRKDQLDSIIYMYLGHIVYKTNKDNIIQQRTYKQILIPRMTTFKTIDPDLSFTQICNELYQNEKRNHLIINDILSEIKNHKNIIVLTDRKEHIQILYNQLKYNDYDIYCMSGENTTKERKEIKLKISNSKHYIIIATSQLLGEGFDLPSLNTMFITMPFSYKGRLSQYVGRLHRDYDDKDIVKVYDYIDIHIPMLQSMFNKRLKTYKSEGYEVIEEDHIVDFNQVIFDKANYEYFLHNNMNKAKKNIVIFINDCKIYRIQRLYSFFTSLLAKGIKIYICIQKEYDQDTLHYLEGISYKIIKTNHSLNAIMIDEDVVWSGSCSYLGVQNNDLFYMRINDKQIVEELKLKIVQND